SINVAARKWDGGVVASGVASERRSALDQTQLAAGLATWRRDIRARPYLVVCPITAVDRWLGIARAFYRRLRSPVQAAAIRHRHLRFSDALHSTFADVHARRVRLGWLSAVF